jgi:hypothetical protein
MHNENLQNTEIKPTYLEIDKLTVYVLLWKNMTPTNERKLNSKINLEKYKNFCQIEDFVSNSQVSIS